MQTQNLSLSKIKPNPSNPRTIKGDKFEKLVNSIQEFPRMLEIRPIVINDDNVILGGNMRLEACKKAGLKEVPVLKASDLSADEQRQFIIKDNVGFGEWDWDLLANEWDNEQLEEWGLDVWQPDDVTELEAEEDDYEAPSDIQTKIIEGDLIEIGEHRLLCGDSTDSDQVAKLMNEEKADMVFTDPPFPNNSEIMHDMIKNIEDAFINSRIYCSGLMIWFWDNLQFPPFVEMVTSKHIWHKTNGWQAGHFETMYCYHNDEKRHEQKVYSANNVGGENKREEQCNHPTPKPITLILEIIKDKKANNILDLFLGSGSTMVASHQLKRKCYGMELDPKYCQVIIDRMLKLDPELDVRINGKAYT